MIDADTFAGFYSAGLLKTTRFMISRGDKYPEDSAQAAWMRAWEKRAQWRGDSSFVSWVNIIALNLLRARRRKRSEAQEPEKGFEIVGRSPEPTLMAAVDAGWILGQIAPKHAGILRQVYFEGHSIVELSEGSGLTPVGARVAVFRARRLARDAASTLKLRRGSRLKSAMLTHQPIPSGRL